MAVIRIVERAGAGEGAVTVDIGQHGEFEAVIKPPFDEHEEGALEWYFEEHLRSPFMGQQRASTAAASVRAYGERLFAQAFADRAAYAAYTKLRDEGVTALRFEIVGSPNFHGLHWEALRDPDMPRAFALDAPMIRLSKTPQVHAADVKPSSAINLLVVTARPHIERDVGYRTITRPLIEGLDNAQLRVAVDIVRPGAYRALQERLENAGAGRYHAVHFDLHGAILNWDQFQAGREADKLAFNARFGRPDLAAYDGVKGFLFFEDEGKDGRADPAEASEIVKLLLAYKIPIVILNACQSGKQAGAREASLAARLLEAGAQTVLGMGYSVTVSAARLMIPELYRHLFDGKGLDASIQRARRLLHDDKRRRAYFQHTIELEDWILPVVYQHRAVELQPVPPTPAEHEAWLRRQTQLFRGPEPTYGFFGRDVDILRIEKRLLSEGNIMLLHGMGGAGKSTLLRHMATWWQKTGFVGRVFYFGYDEKAWTRQQIMHDVASALYEQEPGRFHGSFLPLSDEMKQADLVHELRARRHLLILDNLESVTGSPLSIPNTLDAAERGKLADFLKALKGGRTAVLLGSRGREEWLSAGVFAANIHELGGLDEEAASDLADKVLARHSAEERRADKEFPELMKLLDGYPLALEVVLANLKRQAPGAVLAALREGAEGVDLKGGGRTESILRCIDYSHGNLSAEAQELLLCLAPFSGVFNVALAGKYAEALRKQPELADLAHDRWDEVLKEAIGWGLLSEDANAPGFLRLQPVFPYFLRTRLASPAQAARKAAIERAFREHYDGLGGALRQLITSKDAQRQQLGLALVSLEYANLAEALRLALAQQVSIVNVFHPLSLFFDRTQDHARGLELGEMVLKGLEVYPEESLRGQLGFEFAGAVDDIAKRYLLLHRYPEAEAAYQRVLTLLEKLTELPAELIGKMKASANHQLGYVAGEQRQWAEAEGYYSQALALKVEFNDRYSQALTYHQLGMVAAGQQQWAEAEGYYRQALAIKIEFNDRHSQASTYHQLGTVAEEQRQWAEAEDYYRQALAIYVEFNDRYEQAGTYGQLGNLAYVQQQWAQAKQYYLQALPIYAEFEDGHNAAKVLRGLARLWKASGDASLPEEVGKVLGGSAEQADALLRKALGEE